MRLNYDMYFVECPHCRRLKDVHYFEKDGVFKSICNQCSDNGVENEYRNNPLRTYCFDNVKDYVSEGNNFTNTLDNAEMNIIRKLKMYMFNMAYRYGKWTKEYTAERNEVLIKSLLFYGNHKLASLTIIDETKFYNSYMKYITEVEIPDWVDKKLYTEDGNKVETYFDIYEVEDITDNEHIFGFITGGANAEDMERIRKEFREDKELRKQIDQLKKDTDNCMYCERHLTKDTDKTVEHKIPVSEGGTNDLDNLGIACPQCNKARGSSNIEDFLVQLEPIKEYIKEEANMKKYMDSIDNDIELYREMIKKAEQDKKTFKSRQYNIQKIIGNEYSNIELLNTLNTLPDKSTNVIRNKDENNNQTNNNNSNQRNNNNRNNRK